MMPLAAGAVQPGALKQSMSEGAGAAPTRPTKLFIGGITRNTTPQAQHLNHSCVPD
ncbi:unnamed protein product [Symbiodinium natans]|uniref:Uncharacterized protein n=1 Tax=Symbiodinium natans TaxID=878477 RepID=A0A812SM55_9DINO|nr:unnamed protein product [Symbiodinium natans]